MICLKQMSDMPDNSSWWTPMAKWVMDNTIVFLVFGLAWKGLSQAFKYLSEGRNAEIRAIIKEEINARVDPQITKLTDSIDDLKEAIWALKNKS